MRINTTFDGGDVVIATIISMATAKAIAVFGVPASIIAIGAAGFGGLCALHVIAAAFEDKEKGNENV